MPLIRPLVGPLAYIGGLMHARDEPLLTAMIRDRPPAFLRWCGAAVDGWRPSPPPPTPCLRLHGSADAVIPPPPAGPDVTLVPRAAHLLDGCHAEAVIAWLAGLRDRFD